MQTMKRFLPIGLGVSLLLSSPSFWATSGAAVQDPSMVEREVAKAIFQNGSRAVLTGDERHRTLSAIALAKILTAPLQTDLNVGAKIIEGAIIDGDLDLSGRILPNSFSLPGIQFTGKVNFAGAQIQGTADFTGAEFQAESDFSDASFESETKFLGARFGAGRHSFRFTKFHQASYFSGCAFDPAAVLDFSNVTDFSNMALEWEYDPALNRELALQGISTPTSQRGIRDAIVYNRAFYSALIDNYNGLGRYSDADNVYYECRASECRANGRTWERFLLEIPFGYGVRPVQFLFWSTAIVLGFGIYYATKLSFRPEVLNDKKALKPFLDCNPFTHAPGKTLAWGLRHSVETFVPILSFGSAQALPAECDELENDPSKRLAIAKRVQSILGWYFLILLAIMIKRLWIR